MHTQIKLHRQRHIPSLLVERAALSLSLRVLIVLRNGHGLATEIVGCTTRIRLTFAGSDVTTLYRARHLTLSILSRDSDTNRLLLAKVLVLGWGCPQKQLSRPIV